MSETRTCAACGSPLSERHACEVCRERVLAALVMKHSTTDTPPSACDLCGRSHLSSTCCVSWAEHKSAERTHATALAAVQAEHHIAIQQRDHAYATARADVLKEVREHVVRELGLADMGAGAIAALACVDRAIRALLGGDA